MRDRNSRTKKKAPAELPNWVTQTMDEPTYKLEAMCDCGECTTEEVDLTRDEFIELKRHLFLIRGRTKGSTIAPWWPPNTSAQNA